MPRDYKEKSINNYQHKKELHKMEKAGTPEAFQAQVEMFNRSRERMRKQKAGA